MGELLDRPFQRQILSDLRDQYPAYVQVGNFENDAERRQWLVNVAYLAEHGLITTEIKQFHGDDPPMFGPMVITAAGLDFLADDGGLSAILGVVTVKLHDDTIRQLLIRRIEAAEGDATIKRSLIKKVRALPSEALGKLTTQGLDAALKRAPDLLELLGGLLG